jgi:gentisate 1,2-dioxygenase
MSQTAQSAESRLETLQKDAAALNLVEFWKLRMDIELPQPRNRAVPFLWKWSDIAPRLHAASEIVPIEDCERRALLLSNPGLGGKPYATDTLLGAFSLYNPGEEAPVHRHTPSASRFVLESDGGGFTTVEGEKCQMNRGDLVITPAGTWHDHGNDGQEPLIWVDILNVPLVENLNATMFEFDYTERDTQSNSGEPIAKDIQTISHPLGHSDKLYGTGGVVPLFTSHRRGISEHSPMFVYPWEKTRAALDGMRGYEGDPYDGIIVEYADPATGASVMPTMSFRSQMLRPGEETRAHRHMSSTLYCVLEGSGWTEVDGERIEWGRNDVFAVPGWRWHAHANASKSADAVLYSVTDEPVYRKLGLYREERKDADGTVEVLLN